MGRKLYTDIDDSAEMLFFCPGCQCGHGIRSKLAKGGGAKWEFNGDFEKPTFHPSYLTGIPKTTYDEKTGNVLSVDHFAIKRCHSFITDGRIRFLADCSHALAGQTVELPDIDDQGESTPKRKTPAGFNLLGFRRWLTLATKD